MIPPSPWLSARMMRSTYLSVTTTVSDHRISETTPISSGSASLSPASLSNTVFIT